MNVLIGIDPGSKSAAFAILTRTGKFILTDDAGDLTCPESIRHFADYLDQCLAQTREAVVIMEKVHAYTGQGVTSSFNFGVGNGALLGIVGAFGLPVTLVRPQTWKKSLGLNADEKKSLALARQLYPAASPYLKRVKDHNRGDALLIAHWGLNHVA